MRLYTLLTSVVLLFPAARAQEPITGTWAGAIVIGMQPLEIQVSFRDSAGMLSATIDIPPQHAYGLPLRNVSYHAPVVHFELPAGPGVAAFNGTHSADSISGVFVQGAAVGTFFLRPGSLAGTTPAADSALPYHVEEVTFRDSATVLAGTLTVPAGGGLHPAIVLLTGSGAQNRDEDVLGFKVFKTLADTLTRSGVAVLRFDDRGVGGSSGTQAACTDDDYANDAVAAIDFLRHRPEIDPKRIGLLGHSEGGNAASIAAARHPGTIAFLVLMAGPGLPGDSVINSQIVRLARAQGEPDSAIVQAVQLQHEIIATLRKGHISSRAREELAEGAAHRLAAMTPAQRSAIGDSATFVAQAVERQFAAVQTPWFRRFIDLDPATFLREVQCPVLVLFGALDHQVFPDLNGPPIKRALEANRDGTVRVIPDANHLFQKATTGLPSEYASLPKAFAPEFVKTLVEWLHEHLAVEH